MALLVRKADQWFLCLLPAILLAAVFWFGYAVPQRNHLASMEREMERLGTVDALTAATISSRAYVDAIARAYEAYGQVSGNVAGQQNEKGGNDGE